MKFNKLNDKIYGFLNEKFIRNVLKNYNACAIKFIVPNFLDSGSDNYRYGESYTVNVESPICGPLEITIYDGIEPEYFETQIEMTWEELKITWRKIVKNNLE